MDEIHNKNEPSHMDEIQKIKFTKCWGLTTWMNVHSEMKSYIYLCKAYNIFRFFPQDTSICPY